jgi:hypothetical protein
MPLQKEATITISAGEAALLKEMCEKTAVNGRDAKSLAGLYEKAERAHKELAPKAD